MNKKRTAKPWQKKETQNEIWELRSALNYVKAVDTVTGALYSFFLKLKKRSTAPQLLGLIKQPLL